MHILVIYLQANNSTVVKIRRFNLGYAMKINRKFNGKGTP